MNTCWRMVEQYCLCDTDHKNQMCENKDTKVVNQPYTLPPLNTVAASLVPEYERIVAIPKPVKRSRPTKRSKPSKDKGTQSSLMCIYPIPQS